MHTQDTHVLYSFQQQSKHSDTDIKLADFSFAKKVMTYNGCRTLCGTPGYLAPEILERFPAYDMKCDLWSVGVILFLLLGGYLPFDAESEDGIFHQTRNAEYEFYPDYWREVSAPAKHLIVSLLTLNPAKRVSAEWALNHEWMMQHDKELARRQLSVASLQHSITTAKKDRPLLKTVAVMASDRLKHLHEKFNLYITKCDDDTAKVFAATTNRTMKPAAKPDSAKGLPFQNIYRVGETVSLAAGVMLTSLWSCLSHILFSVVNCSWARAASVSWCGQNTNSHTKTEQSRL